MSTAEYCRLNTAEKVAYWESNPLVGDIEMTVPGAAPFRMRCDNDDTVVKELYWTNFEGWEPATLNLWIHLARKSRVVFDVGAYSGIFSILAAQQNPDSQVFAIEPVRENAQRITQNLDLNHIGNVNVVSSAFSDRCGKITIYEHRAAAGILSSVSSIANSRNATGSFDVSTITADQYVGQQQLPQVDLVKIDVEHAELEVLQGMQVTIREYAPQIILEINDRKKLPKIQSMFPSSYRCRLINEMSWTLDDPSRRGWVPRIRRAKSHGRNYLFTDREIGEIPSRD